MKEEWRQCSAASRRVARDVRCGHIRGQKRTPPSFLSLKAFVFFMGFSGPCCVHEGNLTRLEYSRNMLEETDKTVTEICLEAGFGSQRSFNRVFQEEQHMTPLEYRRFSRGGK